ncbi:DNA endonuclease SmrA [Salinimonas lutimaris]|uniref:DNA endonuclease SmrA n=1 Tax=Salinimonas lutimaris TaxID=914153 RepID=UPI0010C0692E|nr:DNA endonuclease SmrA [Salinimonas lutimaris]
MRERDDDGLQTFLAEMGDVTPIEQNDKFHYYSPDHQIAEKRAKAANRSEREKLLNPLSLEGVKPVRPDDHLAWQQPGIQDGVFKNLRMGKYEIEYRLSLKGLTLDESRDALYKAVLNCHSKGARTLLIQHGTGEQSKPFPAFKKSYVNHWLAELTEVIAWHTAQPHHGGRGATYALLKKHPEQKLINREKNRRR